MDESLPELRRQTMIQSAAPFKCERKYGVRACTTRTKNGTPSAHRSWPSLGGRGGIAFYGTGAEGRVSAGRIPTYTWCEASGRILPAAYRRSNRHASRAYQLGSPDSMLGRAAERTDVILGRSKAATA